MNGEKFNIRAMAAPWKNGVELLIKEDLPDGRIGIVDNFTVLTYRKGEQFQPSLKIGYDEAQVLMDDLWNAGIRPTEGTGSAGSLKATENHLKDMRKLVFKDPC